MGWARIDDAFDDHEKVLALLDLDEGAAALGLWTLCLTWAHRNTRKKGKTPGLLPGTLPRRFLGPRGRELAAILVDVGLWDAVDDGWMIHDFADYLPDKEVSAARREAGKRGAAARWGNRQNDGNLPSGDGKRNGDSTAPDSQPDGQSSLNDHHEAEQPPELEGNRQVDGNLPSHDGNEPSDCHGTNGKPVANDGSRAGARRDRVDVRTTVLFPDPSPEPIPPSAGTAKPRPDVETTAGTIVAEWLDRCQKRPPGQVIGQIGKHVKTMLAEGIDPDDIRRGVAQWMNRKIAASHLPGVVNDVMNAPSRPSRDSPKGHGDSGPDLPPQNYDNPRV